MIPFQPVPVYAPTWDEFKNFSKFIESIEQECTVGPNAPGVCKVIPPSGWRANSFKNRSELAQKIDFPIPTAITQHTTGAKGVYLQMHEELPDPLTFQKFQTMIQDPPKLDLSEFEFPTPTLEVNQLERKYWKGILFNPAIYGSDIAGSLFDSDVCKSWNLQNLNTVLQRQLIKHNMCIPGVSTPFLYVGSYKSTFCWHTEDMELASINFMHFGAPKTWYGIPMRHKAKFEEFVKSEYPDEFKQCGQALRHKQILIAPSILHQHGIKVSRVTQEEGEFIITFPGAYHAGFNHGLNVAEATNFATKSWIPIGERATRCLCDPNTVNIDVHLLFNEEGALNMPEEDDIDFDYYRRNRGDFYLKVDPDVQISKPVKVRIKLEDLPEEHRANFLVTSEDSLPNPVVEPQDSVKKEETEDEDIDMSEQVLVPDDNDEQEMIADGLVVTSPEQPAAVAPVTGEKTNIAMMPLKQTSRGKNSAKDISPSKKNIAKISKKTSSGGSAKKSSKEKRHPLFQRFYGH